MYFRVISEDDPSFAISGDEEYLAYLSVDLDWYDIKGKKDVIQLLGKTLEKTFGKLWSTRVKVYVYDYSDKEDDLLTWREYIKKL